MKPVKYVHSARFGMDMGCLYDVWCPVFFKLGSNVQYVVPSHPVSYDKDNDTVETQNTIYKIESYDMNKDRFYEELDDVIQNNGYLRK